ncbi:hypothetical protein [Desulfocurvus sp.]|jgi:hypothetical protein|uniref:hypothetical protein n=1 Tax=Desulfocurvus sp. TaxID=2871698 RepID=UPI0025C24810|nr:hypothetical protein [Desulfocurvus sp.]MCK9239544.1 hypothetical protein [Desulfocurvus sp.]
MLSKDALIAWLDLHGLLTADTELDVHDGFAAAVRAAAAVPLPAARRLVPWSPGPGAFFAACARLDALVAAGRLEIAEAVVALHLLRAGNKDLHREITRLERRLRSGRPLPADAPLAAREYLGATAETFTTLVAG